MIILRAGFWIAQLLGYPVLVYLVWLWLSIPERSVWQLAGSALLGAAIVLGLAGLFAAAFRARFSRMLIFVVLLALLVGLAFWLSGYAGAAGNWLAAKASYWRRRPANPRAWTERYWWTMWTVCVLLIFTPLPKLAVGLGTILRRWPYWLSCAALVIVGVWLPWKLIWWVPKADTLAAQTTSMVFRFGFAYLLWLGSLLLFAAGVRRFARQP